ncbi:PREDICTED: elongation factor Ts, mitochondrial-like [Amphimedon queenslandica]|uniref:Elongation factor Ts, mitochondrial n=1 Tax=Amphimedon queenslandica TaxID=400682 RepID=A0A1X7UML5_AMPQE|nr:PREDICTED: elongation factor Ts, mitochondrial-like [Amphimedon queenslandica]|eukprot:XP_019853490.1 PREDICTED: elongation factor Ts, mitochondrial-like [Amphimedon queenslandica]
MWLRFSRFYSSVSSSPLAVLRKKTGYQLSKCKEALSLHNNDLSLAEEWLKEQARKEGWIKADLPRATTQGVIAACVDGNAATMLEVNCETDFVARNQNFLQYVSEAARATADHLMCNPPSDPQQHLKPEDLASFRGPGGNLLGDMTAEKIGLLGEKINLTRGYHMRLDGGRKEEGFISSYVYNGLYVSGVGMGRYGCIVHLINKPQPVTWNTEESTSNGSNTDLDDNENGVNASFTLKADKDNVAPLSSASLGDQLAQHIVGCNPRLIGGGGEEDLLTQRFLFDGSVPVGEWLRSHGLSVGSFVRFGVGDTNQ